MSSMQRLIALPLLVVALSGCVGIELAMVGAGRSAGAEDTGFLSDYKALSSAKDPAFPTLPDLWAINGQIRMREYGRIIVPDFTSLTTDVNRIAGLQIRQYRSIKQELADQVANTLDGSVLPKVTRVSDRVDPKDLQAIRRLPADAVLLGNIKELVSLGGENKAGLTGIQVEYKLVDVKTGIEVMTAIHRSTTDLDKVAMAQLRVLTGLLNKAKAAPSVASGAAVTPPAPAPAESVQAAAKPAPAPAPSAVAAPAAQASPVAQISGARPLLTVTEAQEALNARGYAIGGPDGKMGPRTVEALKRFQRAVALPPTGVLDEKTSEALRRK